MEIGLVNYTEKNINLQNKAYLQSGQAFVWKNDPSVRFTGSGTASVSQGIVDYCGLTSDGRFFAFDAKESKKDNFYVSKVPSHQTRFLDKIDAQKGVAFIFVFMFNEKQAKVWVRQGKKWISLKSKDWVNPENSFDYLHVVKFLGEKNGFA